jgi:uncharacterized protein YecT (DUF1311 family)
LQRIPIAFVCLLSLIDAHGTEEDECKDSLSNYCRAQHIHSEYEVADKKLNQAYQALLKSILKDSEPQRLKESLLTSQHVWIQFRDKSCDFVALIEEPGPRGGQSVKCLTHLTNERTKQLTEYRLCLEHDEEKCRYVFP